MGLFRLAGAPCSSGAIPLTFPGKTMRTLTLWTLALMLVLGAAACEPQPEAEDATDADAEALDADAMTADLPDTTGAAVWSYLQDAGYTSAWQHWPGKDPYYTGQEPHGMLLATYLNDVAYEALMGDAQQMPEGSIIVKENYTPDSTLAAVTVMYKVARYNPDHNDWFWTKHTADGSLDTTPDGMAMEGRLAGCQNCHGAQRQNDYVLTGNLGPGAPGGN